MSKSNKLVPFSKKQNLVLTWWCPGSVYEDKDGIICDGSIRSGKSLVMSLSFVFWAMTTFDGENFAFCGKTIQSFRRNVLVSLKRTLRGRGYKIQEHRAENSLTITYGDTENEFYIFGGKDESSQELIQGITLAGIFFDEAALMPESFINQGTGRCSVEGSKFWFNCNPEGPDHFIKKDWIDKISDKNLIRIHFEMRDNPSLSEQMIDRYERMYKGVFYDRFIKGLWVVASGIIFRYLADNSEPYLFDQDELLDERGKMKSFSKLVMGIDFGGTGSKTTMVLMGYMNGYKSLRLLEEDGLPLTDDIDAQAICDKFISFYRRCIETYKRVDWVFPDSASPTMINSLRAAARNAGLRYDNIKGCRKNEITDRPRTIDMLLNSGRLKLSRNCTQVIKALQTIRWDEKKPDIPEDKNIGNCNDWYDAFNYTMLDFIEFIDLNR